MSARLRIGWIGAGRMGAALARRLLAAGHDVAVYNRTRAKAEALGRRGAKVVDALADLAGRDVVFTMVSASADLSEVTLGDGGLLTARTGVPGASVDSSTVVDGGLGAGARARSRARHQLPRGAGQRQPEGGARPGRLTLVVSGPREAYDEVGPAGCSAAASRTSARTRSRDW